MTQRNGTPEEDRQLLELIEAGKSWVFISANLKRPEKAVKDHARLLEAKGDGPQEFREVRVDRAKK